MGNAWRATERPETLYHYTSASAILAIAQSRCVWASNIHFLNDRREFAHALDLAREAVKERLLAEDASSAALGNRLLQIVWQIAEVNMCVFSLSAERDRLSQWRAYCPRAGGFALGFVTSKLQSIAALQGFQLVQCIYDRGVQREAIRTLVDKVFSAHGDPRSAPPERVEQSALSFAGELEKLAPSMKDPAFSEENEWRLVSESINLFDPHWSAHPGRATVIPHFNLSLGDDPQALPFGQIVVGPTADRDMSGRGVGNALMSQGVGFGGVTYSDVPYREI